VESTRIQLDELLKLLLKSSEKMMVPLMNRLFNENYEIGKTKIEVSNGEFIKKRAEKGLPTPFLDVLRADLFLIVTTEGKEKVYHLEIQLKKDAEMAVRIFEYGYLKAEEMRKDDQLVYRFPKPLVIYFEKNSAIGDELELLLIFPDETEYTYRVPVLKYWEKSKQDLLNEKLYALLPLQLFSLRAEMEKAEKHKDKQHLKQLGQLALDLAKEIQKDSLNLKEIGDITDRDFDKLLTAVENLIEYLNQKYMDDPNLVREVRKMTLSVYDREIERAKETKETEVIQNAILKGYSNEIIQDITGATFERIEELRSEL